MNDVAAIAEHDDLLADPSQRENLWRDLLVEIYANVYYQQARRRILERRENFVKVISLVLASGAFLNFKDVLQSTSLKDIEFLQLIFNTNPSQESSLGLSFVLLTIVVVNSWALVFRWNARALDAAKRYDAWIAFEKKVKAVGLTRYTTGQLNDWDAEKAELSIGEAAPNGYLAFKAESEARAVLSHPALPDTDISPLTRLHRIFVSIPKPILAIN